MTIGEAALLIVGVTGVLVNVAALREGLRIRRWVLRAQGIRSAGAVMSHIRRALLRLIASAGAAVIGALAAVTPGRFAGSGVGLGVAIVAGIMAFAAVATASVLDYRERYDFRRRVVGELMAEQRPSPSEAP
jgi:hypothetical protein